MKYIVGIGNMMRGDDGIGSYIVDYIQKNKLEQGFISLDFASNAWSILPLLHTETEKILIIDCSLMQELPGTARFFPLDRIDSLDKTSMENHEASIEQLIQMAKKADYHIPEISIMAIEPENMDFRMKLSASLKHQLADYAQNAISYIQDNSMV